MFYICLLINVISSSVISHLCIDSPNYWTIGGFVILYGFGSYLWGFETGKDFEKSKNKPELG